MSDGEVLELASKQRAQVGGPDPVEPKPSLENEFGVGSVMPFSVPYTDKATVEVLRDYTYKGPTVRQLEVMRRTDGQARALYRLVTLPIRSALQNATFVPDDDGGEKEAEFIDQMFNLPPNAGGMTVTFQRVMAQMLMAIFEGFTAFEQVYWQPKRGPLKGKFTLKKMAHRPSSTVTFLADKNGNFAGLRQRSSRQGHTVDVEIPLRECLYYAANEEENPFYGVSYFESAFYHYDKKVRLYYITHLAAQRSAVGTRKGTMPPNAQQKDKKDFIQAMANLGVAQYITLPEGYDVELLKDSAGFDFLEYINHHNNQMSKSVLAAFFDTTQGGGGAGTSLVDFGEQHDQFFLLMLKTIMDEIAAVINHYVIPKFIDWNFASGKYPKFQWGSFTDEQKASIRATFDKLATAGQSMTVTSEFMFELEKYMANEMSLEIDYKAIEEERAAMKEEAKKQQDQMMQDQADAATQPPEDPNAAPPGQQAQLSMSLSMADLAAEVLRTTREDLSVSNDTGEGD